MLLRGIYCEGWKPSRSLQRFCSQDEFLARVNEGLQNVRPTNAKDGTQPVFKVISKYIEAGEVHEALPKEVRATCPESGAPIGR